MANSLSEYELRNLRDESHRHSPPSVVDYGQEVKGFREEIEEQKRRWERLSGRDGLRVHQQLLINESQPVSQSSASQTERVHFIRNGIVVVRRVLIAGSATAVLP